MVFNVIKGKLYAIDNPDVSKAQLIIIKRVKEKRRLISYLRETFCNNYIATKVLPLRGFGKFACFEKRDLKGSTLLLTALIISLISVQIATYLFYNH